MRSAGHDLQMDLNGVVISYDDYGPAYAPVVIFIHGFPFNKKMWKEQIEELKSNYRVIAFDSFSQRLLNSKAAEISLSVLVEELLALMKVLRIPKAALCGISLGGLVALEAAKKIPTMFTALVLVDTHCEPVSKPAERRSWLNKSLNLFTRLWKRSDNSSQIADADQVFAESVGSILAVLKDAADNESVCDDLTKIRIPVLILVGEYDDEPGIKNAQILHSKLANSRLQTIRFAGHFPNFDNTENFNLRLSDFIKKYARRLELSEPLLSAEH